MARIACERETTLTFNDEEKDALMWSASPDIHRLMEKLGIEPYKISPGRPGAEGNEESRWYRFPKTYSKIAPKRHVSEQERTRLRAQRFGRR